MPSPFLKKAHPTERRGRKVYGLKGEPKGVTPRQRDCREREMRVSQLFCQAIFLIALSMPGISFADFDDYATNGPRWACWYSPASLSVNCLLSRIPTAGLEMRAVEVSSTIDRRLPELVRTIWGSPEKLSGVAVTIPLMTVPYELDFVKTLAKSVMCGRRPDCSLSFDPNKDGKAPVRAAALEAGASEAEVMAEVMLQGLSRRTAEVSEESAVPRQPKQRRGVL